MATKKQQNQIEWTTERRPVSSLNDYPDNPRQFTAKGMADLKASMTRLGYIDPIAINTDGTIIGGHARKKTLVDMGLDEVDVRVPSRLLSDAEVKEAIIRLNKNIAGVFDYDMLANKFETHDLLDWGFESGELGVSDVQDGMTDPDEVPPTLVTPATLLRDTWLLGAHRLRCGDSTSPEDVSALCGDDRAVLMATDPPYLVDYQGGNHPQSWSNKAKVKDKHWDDYNEGDGPEFFIKFLKVALDVALVENPAIYQWHATKRQALVEQAWQECGLLVHQTIIWVKSRAVLTRCHYMWQHEPCFYGWVKSKVPAIKPPNNATTVWEIDSKIEDGASGIHPTQKPVETVRRPVEYHTKPGELIYEPFSGSGTAIITAEMTGRRCYAMEMSPAFVDVAIQRWQNFTGKEAIHEETGERFNDRIQIPETRAIDAGRVGAGA